MAQLSLDLLGSLLITQDGQPLTGFESDKARALLVYVTVEADRPHERTGLARLLWPDLAERSAHNNLRGALTNLRRILGDTATQQRFLISTPKTI